ncbi:unnamed protein product [Closterium sp. NIES-64]|nr:unnamed protein product [Closterium sp. NIES-64]
MDFVPDHPGPRGNGTQRGHSSSVQPHSHQNSFDQYGGNGGIGGIGGMGEGDGIGLSGRYRAAVPPQNLPPDLDPWEMANACDLWAETYEGPIPGTGAPGPDVSRFGTTGDGTAWAIPVGDDDYYDDGASSLPPFPAEERYEEAIYESTQESASLPPLIAGAGAPYQGLGALNRSATTSDLATPARRGGGYFEPEPTNLAAGRAEMTTRKGRRSFDARLDYDSRDDDALTSRIGGGVSGAHVAGAAFRDVADGAFVAEGASQQWDGVADVADHVAMQDAAGSRWDAMMAEGGEDEEECEEECEEEEEGEEEEEEEWDEEEEGEAEGHEEAGEEEDEADLCLNRAKTLPLLHVSRTASSEKSAERGLPGTTMGAGNTAGDEGDNDDDLYPGADVAAWISPSPVGTGKQRVHRRTVSDLSDVMPAGVAGADMAVAAAIASGNAAAGVGPAGRAVATAGYGNSDSYRGAGVNVPCSRSSSGGSAVPVMVYSGANRVGEGANRGGESRRCMEGVGARPNVASGSASATATARVGSFTPKHQQLLLQQQQQQQQQQPPLSVPPLHQQGSRRNVPNFAPQKSFGNAAAVGSKPMLGQPQLTAAAAAAAAAAATAGASGAGVASAPDAGASAGAGAGAAFPARANTFSRAATTGLVPPKTPTASQPLKGLAAQSFKASQPSKGPQQQPKTPTVQRSSTGAWGGKGAGGAGAAGIGAGGAGGGIAGAFGVGGKEPGGSGRMAPLNLPPLVLQEEPQLHLVPPGRKAGAAATTGPSVRGTRTPGGRLQRQMSDDEEEEGDGERGNGRGAGEGDLGRSGLGVGKRAGVTAPMTPKGRLQRQMDEEEDDGEGVRLKAGRLQRRIDDDESDEEKGVSGSRRVGGKPRSQASTPKGGKRAGKSQSYVETSPLSQNSPSQNAKGGPDGPFKRVGSLGALGGDERGNPESEGQGEREGERLRRKKGSGDMDRERWSKWSGDMERDRRSKGSKGSGDFERDGRRSKEQEEQQAKEEEEGEGNEEKEEESDKVKGKETTERGEQEEEKKGVKEEKESPKERRKVSKLLRRLEDDETDEEEVCVKESAKESEKEREKEGEKEREKERAKHRKVGSQGEDVRRIGSDVRRIGSDETDASRIGGSGRRGSGRKAGAAGSGSARKEVGSNRKSRLGEVGREDGRKTEDEGEREGEKKRRGKEDKAREKKEKDGGKKGGSKGSGRREKGEIPLKATRLFADTNTDWNAGPSSAATSDGLPCKSPRSIREGSFFGSLSSFRFAPDVRSLWSRTKTMNERDGEERKRKEEKRRKEEGGGEEEEEGGKGREGGEMGRSWSRTRTINEGDEEARKREERRRRKGSNGGDEEQEGREGGEFERSWSRTKTMNEGDGEARKREERRRKDSAGEEELEGGKGREGGEMGRSWSRTRTMNEGGGEARKREERRRRKGSGSGEEGSGIGASGMDEVGVNEGGNGSTEGRFKAKEEGGSRRAGKDGKGERTLLIDTGSDSEEQEDGRDAQAEGEEGGKEGEKEQGQQGKLFKVEEEKRLLQLQLQQLEEQQRQLEAEVERQRQLLGLSSGVVDS